MNSRKNSGRSTVNMEKLLNRFFFIVLPILLGLSIAFSYYSARQNTIVLQQVKQLSEDNRNLTRQNKDLSQQVEKDTENINATLQCIFTFFSAEIDRPNTKIATYNPCVLENKVTGEKVDVTQQPDNNQVTNPSGTTSQGSPEDHQDPGPTTSPSPSESPLPSTNPTPEPPQEERGILQNIMNWFRNLF